MDFKGTKNLEDMHFAVVRSQLKAVGRQHGFLPNFANTTLEPKRFIASWGCSCFPAFLIRNELGLLPNSTTVSKNPSTPRCENCAWFSFAPTAAMAEWNRSVRADYNRYLLARPAPKKGDGQGREQENRGKESLGPEIVAQDPSVAANAPSLVLSFSA